MPGTKLTTKPPILKAVIFFFLVFIVSVILWTQVNNYYCYAIILAASKSLAIINDAAREEVVRKGDAFYVSLGFLRGSKSVPTVVTLVVGAYGFNVPLTLSLLTSLSLFIKRKKRAFAEALLLLLLSQFLYVFFTEARTLTGQLMLKGVDPVNTTRLSIYQYLWKASEIMVVSFGPFLVGVYTFVRFRR